MKFGKLGIGIDIVNIERFNKKQYSSHRSFYEKIFLDSEIKYCLKYKDQASHFAGKFALKEAVKKSIPFNVDLLDIKTSYSKSKPIVKLKNKINYFFHASLSHERKFAIAIVISEKYH